MRRDEGGDEQTPEDARESVAGPGSTIEHAMIVLELALVLQAMRRRAAVTVRLPGAKIAPMSKTFT
jgi:hypothetical protein